jgi:hypothetical protein
MKLLFAASVLSGVLLSGSALAAAPGGAQVAPPIIRAPIDCLGIADGAARLRCYDTAVGALAEATRNGAIVVLDEASVRKTRRSLFGFDLPDLPFFNKAQDEPEAPKELVAKVKSVRPFGHKMWLVEIETGAIWQTTEAQTQPPRVGEEIKIRKAIAGGYMIQIGQQLIRTKRVR